MAIVTDTDCLLYGVYVEIICDALFEQRDILFALRCTAIAALVFALAAPYLTLRANEEQILFVVDRSVSIAGAKDAADEWLAESLKERKENQSVGLYSFAETFRTDMQLTDGALTVPVVEEMETKDATDIAKAIDLRRLLPKNNWPLELCCYQMDWRRSARSRSYCRSIAEDVSRLIRCC